MFLIEWVQKKTIVASATVKTIEKALELADRPNEHNATRVVIYQKAGWRYIVTHANTAPMIIRTR